MSSFIPLSPIWSTAAGWTIGVRFPAGTIGFSIIDSVQTDSRAHPVSYMMGTKGSFPGGKAAGA
jgi:hypothetical protein